MIPMPVYFCVGMAILAAIDWKWYVLPNWLIVPLIAVSAHLTGNWQWAVIMFAIGAGFFSFKWKCTECGHTESHTHAFSLHRGGDVKLFALIGAVLGWKALPVVAAGYALVFLYRAMRYVHSGLPVTPFMFLPFVIAAWL